jgi:endoglucanase
VLEGLAAHDAALRGERATKSLRWRRHRVNRTLCSGSVCTLAFALACGTAEGETEDPAPPAPFDGMAGAPAGGVNLAGADFGESNPLPGIYEDDYIYPSAADVDLFLDRHVTLFRVPFLWERLQRALNTELDTDELARLDALVGYITARGATVVLDPHNYARYVRRVVGLEIDASALADFWARLARVYRGNPRVVFALMNEPHDMPTEVWRDDANRAISAIRGAGATNLILVPGNAWTGAWSWEDSWYGTSNAVAMLAVRDPLQNLAFEVHQYLDPDYSGGYTLAAAGTSPCGSPTLGAERLGPFIAWAQAHGVRGFLGEFGVPAEETCLSALDVMLEAVEASQVFIGWTYWAAGPWWGDYPLSVQPDADGTDKPQFAVLAKHL